MNLPNLITVGRVFMIPPTLMLIDQRNPWFNFIGFAVFLIASGLDVLDGYLARRQNLVTFFGKFVDPLADKVMVSALLVYLASEGRIPPWVVVVLLSREFYMSGIRTLALGEGVEIVAQAGGKAKTAFQMTAISFIILYNTYSVPVLEIPIDFHGTGMGLLYIATVQSVWSAFQYTRGFIHELSKPRPDASLSKTSSE